MLGLGGNTAQPMKTYSGIVLLTLALGMLMVNLADSIADLKDWHDQSGNFTVLSPAFVGTFLKQLGSVVIAAIGGNLLPTPGVK